MNRSMPIKVYTDGACSGNPGPGGWAAIINYGTEELVVAGGEEHTTNNRMELQAAINALSAIAAKYPSEYEVIVFTDSKYVQQGINEWIDNWKKNNWRNAKKKTVFNIDLWQTLDKLSQQMSVEWHWVKGHSDDELNERVDGLARAALEKYKGKEKYRPAVVSSV